MTNRPLTADEITRGQRHEAMTVVIDDPHTHESREMYDALKAANGRLEYVIVTPVPRCWCQTCAKAI